MESVVIGAGVVGLAVARRLAEAGRDVLILERGGEIAGATSSRNSEVIHAGIYYPKGSQKARLCVAGKLALYRYLEERGLPHRRLGKVIVACDAAEAAGLPALRARAAGNGVTDLEPLDRAALRRLEPALEGVAGLYSPSTGILDSHAYCLSLLGEAEAGGAVPAFLTPVEGIRVQAAGLTVTTGGADPMTLQAREVVNAAGLWAPALAARTEGLAAAQRPRARFAKGSYFALEGRSPFRHLIYPVPVPGGLGTHLTLDLGGRARFGPDVEWLEGGEADALDYAVDPGRRAGFEAAIRRWWPGLPEGALAPAFAGVRPKLLDWPEDFVVAGPESHGVAGLVNLFGIESPGLTASLALAEEVAQRLGVTPRPL